MPDLIRVADCAYPFDYRELPDDVKIILGYVGQRGCTPNVWTPKEVRACQVAGYRWAPIHTPPQVPFNGEMGKQAGNLMLEELRDYELPAGHPVFLDIERESWAPNPHAAMQGVGEWQAIMRAAGHPQAWPYLPAAAGYGWVADWVNAEPKRLAKTVIGVQYQGNDDHGKFDLSVFNSGVFASLSATKEAPPMAFDAEEKAFIIEQLTAVQAHLGTQLERYAWDSGADDKYPFALVHLKADVDDIKATLAKPKPGPVDTDALAGAIVKAIGSNLAGELADNLATRLKS